MNKRQRDIIARLQPAVDFALNRAPGHQAGERSHRGLSMTKRVSADSAAELMIYGRIGGGGWFDEGIGANDVAAALRDAGPGPINVRLNSPGGDVFDGVAIHSLLARHPGTVTVYVDGLAASAASFIMLAGDRIVSARNAFVMIHGAMTATYGNAGTHREAAELLDKVSDNIADMYAERAGEDPQHWRDLMDANREDGTWYTGQEALDAGLVDELTAVPDDFDEDAAIADRLKVWQNVLPQTAREFISNHPAEDDEDAWDDDPLETDVDELSQEEIDEAFETGETGTTETPVTEDAISDEDFAFAMQMFQFTNGHAAR